MISWNRIAAALMLLPKPANYSPMRMMDTIEWRAKPPYFVLYLIWTADTVCETWYCRFYYKFLINHIEINRVKIGFGVLRPVSVFTAIYASAQFSCRFSHFIYLFWIHWHCDALFIDWFIANHHYAAKITLLIWTISLASLARPLEDLNW